jgi:hypothetical protein
MSDQDVSAATAPDSGAAVLPYIVSADVQRLFAIWAEERGFTLPEPPYFTTMRARFEARMQALFPMFEMLGEEELASGLSALVREAGGTVVSLDRAYTSKGAYFLDIARAVNDLNENVGLRPRPGARPLAEQVETLRSVVRGPITLVDDVIFSGDGAVDFITLLQGAGMEVSSVRAAICVGDGFRKVSQLVADVKCVRYYERLYDEVCERDFYPGAPFAGRVLAEGGNVGVPYVYPFGKPTEWASVPKEHAASFSAFCIEQSIDLFAAIERASGREVRCQDLSRFVKGLPQDSTRFIDALILASKGI